MSVKTDYFLKALHIISWIIFIGVCFDAGVIIFNTVFTLVLHPDGTRWMWKLVDLSELYHHNQSHYVTLTALMIIVAVLRAIMFYLIVKVFHDNKLNLSHPFNEPMHRFIQNIAYLALGIGLFSYW